MEEIARAAKIAKPTLYAYFPEKASVFDAIVGQLTNQWSDEFKRALRGEGDIVMRVAAALTAKHKSAMKLLAGSPHAAELYGAHDRLAGPKFQALETELANSLEVELVSGRVANARMLTQVLLAAAQGIGQRAQSPAELGPAIRLLAERMIRPELP